MRIHCPNCTRQYSIPDRAIPDDGREVQCAACGHVWYQLPAHSVPSIGPGAPSDAAMSRHSERATGDREAEPRCSPGVGLGEQARPFTSAPSATDTRQAVESVPLEPEEMQQSQADEKAPPSRFEDPATAPVPTPSKADVGEDRENDSSREDAPSSTDREVTERVPPVEVGPEAAEAAQRRSVDPEVLKILQEEAALETARRDTEGLHRAPPKQAPGDARLARLRAAERASGPLTPLPDTEAREDDPGAAERQPQPPFLDRCTEPTAPLRPAAPEAPNPFRRRDLPVALTPSDRSLIVARQQRRGFRLGFASTAGLCCLAVAVYVAAHNLAGLTPSVAPVIDAVVTAGDALRARVVAAVREALAAAGVRL
jgi:predicted Zn finger-like uncharacterized protein